MNGLQVSESILQQKVGEAPYDIRLEIVHCWHTQNLAQDIHTVQSTQSQEAFIQCYKEQGSVYSWALKNSLSSLAPIKNNISNFLQATKCYINISD